jgi:hypothetical protein
MALTQFMQILLLHPLRKQAHHSRRSQLLRSKYLCRIAELTPPPEERLKRATVHLFIVVTTQGACRRKRRRVSAKLLTMRHGERNINGGMQGNCRRWEKIDESNVIYSAG